MLLRGVRLLRGRLLVVRVPVRVLLLLIRRRAVRLLLLLGRGLLLMVLRVALGLLVLPSLQGQYLECFEWCCITAAATCAEAAAE